MGNPRIAFVQWPESLRPVGPEWDAIRRDVEAAQADILVTNEMPFGPWLAESPTYDSAAAEAAIELHQTGLDALRDLAVPTVVSSRPVAGAERLINEAFALEGGAYRRIHHKQFLPEEPGFAEATWFEVDRSGFDVVRVGDIGIGVLLCTELFFNEHARAYGHAGADLIVTPRASSVNMFTWRAAGTMAAIVSGAYVVSSNRVGQAAGGTRFGGTGFAYAPTGAFLSETTADHPIQVVELDLDVARAQKTEYPCYVAELDAAISPQSSPTA